MKKITKLVSILLIVACIGGALMMAGCEKEPEAPAQTEYKVVLKDHSGAPVGTGVIAVFYKDGVQAAMQPCNADGVAAKTLDTDTYTVKLQFTGSNAYYYHEDDLKVTADSAELQITLYAKASGEQETLNIPQTTVDELGLPQVTTVETKVYQLNEGATYVEVVPGEMTYFLFTPTRGGKFEFSVLEGTNCTFSYYGNPNYIRETPTQDIVDGVTTVNIENSAVTNDEDNTIVMVLAVNAAQDASNECIVRIERVGDTDWSPDQEEWIIYKPTEELEKCQVPEGVELKDFDLTQEYDIVFSKKDCLYHVGSEDGPVVYVYLTQDPRFVDCFQTILEEGTVRAYFYDENGKFVKKEAYGSCLKEYFEYVDDAYGVYPLNQDLMYIIKSYGAHQGWWDRLDKGFIVDVDNLNVNSAWLFLCCYEE